MYNLICKWFIPNYEDVSDVTVRQRYGTVFSIFSIIWNIIMVIIKLIISFITNSVSIRADAFNNLSDVGSNLATLFGFVLSNKHPDADHPYGHGRMEYISGLVVSFLILLMGFEAAKESFIKIIHPESISFSYAAIIVLVISIGMKLMMAYVNKKAGKDINSETLLAASQDSINDSLVTGATLLCLVFYKLTSINIDAYLGLIASILVIKSGVGVFSEVLGTILGKAPEKELILDIEKTVKEHKEALGIHDLIVHDYGPSQKFMSFHIEVDCKMPVIEAHDMIDNIEMELLEKYNILTTIHMDPVDTKDKLTNSLRIKVKDIVLSINENYNIHDFRIVKGPTHTNIVFDVLVPADDRTPHDEIKKAISKKVKKLDKTYICVINVDHSYV